MENTTYIAVITGDIVASTRQRGKLRKALDKLLKNALDTTFVQQDRKDIFRGDSFQVETDVQSALRRVLQLRSFLKMNDVQVRMAIGIGSVDYKAKNVKQSDGEAYQLSGAALDGLDKNEFLKVVSPWRDYNKVLDTIVVLLDSHFINHTILQAEAVYYALGNMPQLEIAGKLKITQPAVNNRLKGASYNAIETAVRYVEEELIKMLATINTNK